MAKENLEEFAYNSIVNLILEYRFKPGDSLLETELSESLGLSRTPVRHALGQLTAEGFLEKKKKKGCIIPPVSPEDARHVFFARENIEGLIAALASRHATDEDIEFLWKIIEREKRLDHSPSKIDYVNVNKAFHMGIARICRNKYLEQYCRHSFWRSHTYIFFFDEYYIGALESEIQEKGPGQHVQIVKAIENGNEKRAANLMRQHIQTTFKDLFGRL